MIKYRTGGYGGKLIKKIEIEKESEKSVWVKNEYSGKIERCLKSTEYHNYFDTWEQAKRYLLDVAVRRVDTARRILELEKSYLGNIKGLTNKGE